MVIIVSNGNPSYCADVVMTLVLTMNVISTGIDVVMIF